MFLLSTHVDTIVHAHDAHMEVKQPRVLSDLLDTWAQTFTNKTRPGDQQISRDAPSLLPTSPLPRLQACTKPVFLWLCIQSQTLRSAREVLN